MTTINLYSTTEQVDLLFEQEDRPRSTATRVAVDREALKAVLMDHANLINALRDVNVTIKGIDQ